MNNGFFNIEFTGAFCQSCGFYDYFDDYKILLDEKGLKTIVGQITELDEKAIVTFEVIDSE